MSRSAEDRMRKRHFLAAVLLAVAGLVGVGLGAGAAGAQDRPVEPLTGKSPPAPPAAAYDAIVQDTRALVVLGKALFWDSGVGSRGDLACASCHFHAGADPRTTNQLNPGLLVLPEADPSFGSTSAGLTGSGAKAGPNYALRPGDFPFHRLSDPDNRNSAVEYDTNDVASSAGAYDEGFISPKGQVTIRGRRTDLCGATLDAVFHVAAGDTRKVAPRNTPTTVNTAFMRRNFWDGRASNVFNGVDPFGRATVANDPTARIVVLQGTTPVLRSLELPNMSAASQAVGPPLSNFEMACAGRGFAAIGRRLLNRQALAGQAVAADDGVLGRVRSPTGKGLSDSYDKLVGKAFRPVYRQAAGYWRIGPAGTLA
jgi:hypothetical protein